MIDHETTINAFNQKFKINGNLAYNGIKCYQFTNPGVLMGHVLEIIAHGKSQCCIEAPSQSGRSLSCVYVLLDLFLKSQVRDDIGSYLLLASASREGSQSLKQIAENLLQGDNVAIVDLNAFFPLKGKCPPLVLPPLTQKTVLIGTLHTLSKVKALGQIAAEGFKYCLFDDCALAEIYGGQEHLKEIASWVQQAKHTIFIGEEAAIEATLGKPITLAKIEEEPVVEEKVEKKDSIQSYYFLARDAIQQKIVLYVTLKLSLMQGKTLIIVKGLQELYYMQLFLTRSAIEKFQIYNFENPKSLKYYVLSIFNTGVVSILVATPELFHDLDVDFHERQAQKDSKKVSNDPYSLKRLENLIYFDLPPNYLNNSYTRQVTTQLSIYQNNEENAEYVMTSLAHIKEYPLKANEIEAFRYRIEDVIKNISKHQVKMAQQLDFKKKMLKSPDLVEYFMKNTKEKQMLQDSVVSLKIKLRNFEICLPPGPVPEYLLPSMIRQQRKSEDQQHKRTRVLLDVEDKSVEQVRKKRRIMNELQNEHNLLPKEDEPEEKRQPKERYVNVNQDEEDPLLVDASRLKITSSRKMWKVRHGFKLKKKNKRLEKKGIFTT